jgi:hydrogenase expression/formation protein HypC
MCLAIPARIISIKGEEAVTEIQGVRRRIIISLIPDPRVGDHVLIHAGFAIRKWSKSDVREFNRIVRGIGK